METKVYTQEGTEKGKIKLSEKVFGLAWNADLVHQVATSMMSNARSSIANTKTRGEVSGGGKKPWQQKGTGRARHGSSRSPIWVGGGITHGPRSDKNYSRKINRKMKAKALYTVLSRKMKDGELLFVDSLVFTAPKTTDAKKTLENLSSIKGFEKLNTKRKNAAMIALGGKNVHAQKSFRNFGNIAIDDVRNLNIVSLMKSKFLVIENPVESLKFIESKLA